MTGVLAGRAVGAAGPKGEAIAQDAVAYAAKILKEQLSIFINFEETEETSYATGTPEDEPLNENLFRSVLQDTYDSMMATFRGIAEKHLGEVTDVQQSLTAFALEVARTMTTAPDRIALVRLIMAEAPFFPALVRAEQPSSTMHGNVAAFLARLAGQGRLATTDPTEAAEHLLALTVNQINARTTFGIVPISDAEVERIVTGGVAAFVRAYRGPAER